MNENINPIPAPDGRVKVYSKPAPDTETQQLAPPDLSEGAPTNFPVNAFPLLLRQIAEEMAAVYQTPVCLPAMSALAVLSGAVGKSVVVLGGYKDKKTCLNLYVISAAERGTGKGNIGELLARAISDRSRELAAKHSRAASDRKAETSLLKKEIQRFEMGAVKAQGLERANLMETLRNRQQSVDQLEAEAGREVSLWVADCTSQKLARALADNGETLFSYSSEAGGVLKVLLGRYNDGKGDFDFYLSAFSGDAVRVDRIGRPSLELQNPCLSLLWLVQGSVLRELLADNEAFSRGLTARMLVFDTGARRAHDDRRSLTFTQAEKWGAFLNGILDDRLAGAPPKEVTCTGEAREVFAKFDDESVNLERGPFADLAGELSRWRENAIKVAGLFATAEGSKEVAQALAERAVSVVRWCGFNYLGLLQAGRRERLRDELERVLELIRENDGAINLGTLERNHGIKRARLESLIAAFPTHLAIERFPQPGRGRPAEVLKAGTKSTISNK